jgi:hypothetical protein
MSTFITGHATHPDWRMALALAAAQLDAQRARSRPPGRWAGLPHRRLRAAGRGLLAELQQRWPGVAWAGCVGVGVPPAAWSTSTSRRWC